MNIPVYNDDLTLEEYKDIGYWERNVLALLIARIENNARKDNDLPLSCGWYYDRENNWEGWLRVISLFDGSITFHIPDDFQIGDLEEIEPNWDGHTTKEKYERILNFCGVQNEI